MSSNPAPILDLTRKSQDHNGAQIPPAEWTYATTLTLPPSATPQAISIRVEVAQGGANCAPRFTVQVEPSNVAQVVPESDSPRTVISGVARKRKGASEPEVSQPKRSKVEETSIHEEELFPTDDAQFLRWAAKEIRPHVYGNSSYLSMLAAVLSKPEKRKSTLKTALVILKLHHARLEKQVNHIKSACEDIKKNGKMSGASEVSAAMSLAARSLMDHFDRFAARVDLLEATFKSL
jgi:hypothetical protein